MGKIMEYVKIGGFTLIAAVVVYLFFNNQSLQKQVNELPTKTTITVLPDSGKQKAIQLIVPKADTVLLGVLLQNKEILALLQRMGIKPDSMKPVRVFRVDTTQESETRFEYKDLEGKVREGRMTVETHTQFSWWGEPFNIVGTLSSHVHPFEFDVENFRLPPRPTAYDLWLMPNVGVRGPVGSLGSFLGFKQFSVGADFEYDFGEKRWLWPPRYKVGWQVPIL